MLFHKNSQGARVKKEKRKVMLELAVLTSSTARSQRAEWAPAQAAEREALAPARLWTALQPALPWLLEKFRQKYEKPPRGRNKCHFLRLRGGLSRHAVVKSDTFYDHVAVFS